MPYLLHNVGDRIRDDLVVEEVLPQGGVGRLYVCNATLAGVSVVVKTCNRDCWDGYNLAEVWRKLRSHILANSFRGLHSLTPGDYVLASFFREARLVRRTDHPNLIRGLNFWHTDDGQPFLVMDNLTRLLVSRGFVSGSYSPPENRVENPVGIGSSSDIYSLGATAYELLGGDLGNVHQDTCTGPRAYVDIPRVPEELNKILAKCLKYDRHLRYQIFAELKDALAGLVVAVREGGIPIKEGCRCTRCGFIPRGVPARRPQGIATGARRNAWGHDFVEIPGGAFFSGCPEGKGKRSRFGNYMFTDEDVYKSVPLPRFFMSRHPVTNAQYRHFGEAVGHRRPRHWRQGAPPFPDGDADKPVVNVSYLDATAYCQRLKLRLPTGLEWEKAARGTNGWLYPWGDDYIQGYCNSIEGNRGGPVPVDEYPSGDSPYGCRQMVGNVLEWVNQPCPLTVTRGIDTCAGARGTCVVRRGARRSRLTTWPSQITPVRLKIRPHPTLAAFESPQTRYRNRNGHRHPLSSQATGRV